ncbi:MAG: hypothetical protein ACNA8W_19515 [Bradymonadaceae bacterium]
MGVSSRFSSYSLSVGRRLLILQAILKVAQEIGDQEIAARSKRAIAHDREAWLLQQEWKLKKKQPDGTRPEAATIDTEVDRGLGGCFRTANNFVRSLPPDNPLHQDGKAFIEEFFAEGISDVTNLLYEDQLPVTEEYVRKWNGPWRERVDRMGLRPFIDQIAALLPRYREALVNPQRRELTYNQVQAAQATGEELYFATYGLILGLYGENTPEAKERRTRYLAVHDDQQRRLRELHRRRRPAPEVNPDTGAELPADADDVILPVFDGTEEPIEA